METIILNNKPVAVGLTWRPLQSDKSEEQEIKEKSLVERSRIGYIARNKDEGHVLVGFANAKAKRGIACGAAWLAKAMESESPPRKHVLLIEPLEDDRSWVCAVSAGVPVADFDFIVENSQLQDRLGALPNDRTFEVVSTHDFVEDKKAQSFAELVQNVDPEVLRQITGIPTVYLQGIAGLAVLVVAGFTYNQASAYLQRMKLTAQSQQAVIKQAADQRAAQARLQADADSRIQAAVAHHVTGRPDPKATVGAWLDVMEQLPSRAMGWTLSQVECVDDMCAATFSRTRFGTILTFKHFAEEKTWKVSLLKGNRAVVQFAASAQARSGATDELPESVGLVQVLSTELQRAELAGLSFEMRDAEPVVVPLGQPDPNLPAAPADVVKSAYSLGKILVSGTKIFEIRDAITYLEPSSAIALAKLTFNYDGSTWAMEINYASK